VLINGEVSTDPVNIHFRVKQNLLGEQFIYPVGQKKVHIFIQAHMINGTASAVQNAN
jgi:hypothetical protein